MKKYLLFVLVLIAVSGCSFLPVKTRDQIDQRLLKVRLYLCGLPSPLKEDLVDELVKAEIFHPNVCVGIGE